MATIELENLTKEYGEVTAVDGLDLTVEDGEIFGFLGPNGAGKSTTINILLDFVRPTSGRVSVLGRDPQEDSLEIRRRSGLLPEGYGVYDRLTGRQHMEFMIEAKRATDDPIAVMERVGIAHAADRRAGGYSKGMQQRLALAMALVGQPDLIIFDEPSTGLDPNGAEEVLEIMREENARGATVFFSSHILSQIDAVCDRIAIMSQGRLVTEGTVDELREAIGMERTIRIQLHGPAVDALDPLEAVDGVHGTAIQNGTVEVIAERGSETAILNALQDADLSVLDFTTDQGSLRELFAEYTRDRSSGESGAEEAAP